MKLTIDENDDRYGALLEELVAMMAARKDPGAAQLLLNYIKDTGEQSQFIGQAAVLEGIAQALQNNGHVLSFTQAQLTSLVQNFFNAPSPKVRRSSLHVLQAIPVAGTILSENMMERALTIATDRSQSEGARADAIDLIALRNPAIYGGVIKGLFVPQEPLPVQLAALRALSAIPDNTVCHYLLETWSLITPQLQDAAVRTFLVDDQRVGMLLNAIEKEQILPSSVSWPRRVGLMTQRNEKLRNRSRAIFTKNNEHDVNKEYQKALSLKGSADKGKIVFMENCSLCHQVRGSDGIAIGPDLGTVHNWSPSAIMAHTLDPNLSISSGFDLWSIQLNSGESVQGIIVSESPGAVTLRNVGAKEKTISRNEIKSIEALNMSIMPTGLNEQISKQQMADLLAFLKDNVK